MKRFALLFGLVLVMGGLVFAQMDKEQARKLIDTYKNAALKVKVIITSWSVFQGQESSKEESKYEVMGTLIDKKGTLVTSVFAVDPSKLFRSFLGEEGGYQMKSELKELKIILPDNKEVEGKVVLRDDMLDLAFIRPKSPPENIAFEYVDLDNAAEPQLLDEVISIQRLGEDVDRSIFVTISRIGGIISKPRFYYIPMDDLEPGSPVFTLDGKFVGLNAVRLAEMEGTSYRYFSISSESSFSSVILPAKTIKESAAQIKE